MKPAALLALAPFVAAQALADPAPALTTDQLAAAAQVFVGDADCDLKQQVKLRGIEGKPGHFELQYLKARYVLVPEPTRTGAVRLEDRTSGMVWIQIPAKSMLLDGKQGRRVVDGCLHAEQRPQVLDSLDARSLAQVSTFGISALGR